MSDTGGKKGLVSVVVPTYRRSRYLGRALGTVFGQRYRDWELIVVDDNPPDSEDRRLTREFMQAYLADPRVSYIEHDRNRGGGAARNTGIRSARGEFVAFLDDDDEWLRDKLLRQVACMRTSGDDLGLVYCGFRRVFTSLGTYRDQLPTPAAHELGSLLAHNSIGTTSLALCRRQALLDVGMFDEHLPARQDVDLYVRMAKRYRLDYVPEILVTWYRHEAEAIGKNFAKATEAHRYFLEKHAEDIRRFPRAHGRRLFELARLLHEQGQYGEARRLYLRALAITPGNLSAFGQALMANRSVHSLVVGTRGVRHRLKRALGREDGSGRGSASTST